MKKNIVFTVAAMLLVLSGVFTPMFSVFAQATTAGTPVDISNDVNYESRLEPCVFELEGDGGTFVGCLIRGFYYLVYYFSAWVTETTASVLDFFIGYSIDSKSYAGDNNTFVLRGWAVIRDIANVLFIFTLLYIAIRHILQLAGSDTKKLLKSLIIAALLINFSLFFTKVIIDAGNVLARAFYNNIEVVNDSGTGGKKISQAIVAHINPQKILSSEFLTPKPVAGQAAGTISSGYMFFILVLTAFINFTVAITFVSVFIFFIARVIGLWFMMIFSPLAFVSIAVPSSGKMFGDFGWDSWLEQTLKLSFMAPIFMFFLFLLTMFLQIIKTAPASDASTVEKLMGVLIPFLVVIVVLNVAKEKAKDMSGKFGEGLKSAVAKLSGFALGAVGMAGGMALGAAAFTARNTVGRSSLRELNSGVHQENVRLSNARAEAAEKAGDADAARRHRREAMNSANKVAQLDKRAKGSFDIRRSEFLKKNVFGSAVGKKLVGSGGLAELLGSEMTGEKLKLDLGKGKETSRKKYEEDKEKKALDAAKLYDGGGQSEATLATLGYTARKGVAAKDELIQHIDKYMSEIKNNELMTEKEKKDRLDLAEVWKVKASEAKSSADMEKIMKGEGKIDNPEVVKMKAKIEEAEKRNKELEKLKAAGTLLDHQVVELNGLPDEIEKLKGGLKTEIDNKGEKIDGFKGTADEIKKFTTEARNAFANTVEARRGNGIIQLLGENYKPQTRQDYSSVVADKIRKGPKGEMDKTIKELIKETQDKDSKPKSTPPPAATPPPPGPTAH